MATEAASAANQQGKINEIAVLVNISHGYLVHCPQVEHFDNL
jgi:hypothetical protein